MKETFVNMAFLFAIDILLIAIVSWMVILFMESDLRQKWRQTKEKISTYICLLRDVLREDWQYERIGCIFLFMIIIGALILPCVLAYYIPLEQYYLWNIFEKFISEHPLFTSIMGTFVGIVLIFVTMRPRMRIEKKLMTIDTRKGAKHLKIRIRNLGLFPINNVDVQLLFYREVLEDGRIIKYTKKIELLRPDSPILRGIFPIEVDPTYGCATKMIVEELKEARRMNSDPSKEYEGIVCRVKATHAISGVTYVREHQFEKDEVDEFLNKYCSMRTCNDISTETACDKIISDIEELNEQMKDIKKNIKFIQKENKKNQKS